MHVAKKRTKHGSAPKRRLRDPTIQDLPGSIAAWIQHCEPCGKRLYIRREDAKAVAREHHPRKGIYHCPEHLTQWHVGSLPVRVKLGAIDRRSVYGGVRGTL